MAGLFCDSSSDDEFLALAAFTICALSRLKKKTKKKKGASLTRRPFESHKLREEQLSRTSTRKEVQLNSQKIQTNQKEHVESPIHKVSEMEQTSERVCIASEIERWKETKKILNIDKDEQFAQLQMDSFYATQSAQSSQDVQSVRPKVPAGARASPPQNSDTKLHLTVTSDERGNPYPQLERCKETTARKESLPQDHEEIVPLSIIKHERTGEQVLKVEIKNEPVQLIQQVQPVHEFYDGQEVIRVIKQEESDSDSLSSCRNNEMGVDIKEEGTDSCNPLGDETEMKATSYSPFKIYSTSTRHPQETDSENHVDILARAASDRITKFKEEYIPPACDAGKNQGD